MIVRVGDARTLGPEAIARPRQPSKMPLAGDDESLASSEWRLRLTERPMAIVRAVARGLSNREVADVLGRALDTVKARLATVLTRPTDKILFHVINFETAAISGKCDVNPG